MRWTAASLILAATVVAGQDVTQQQPPAGAFRSRVTFVPLDVRVLDRNGKPITDLTREDFTVIEDGAPQTISHFAVQSLTAVAKVSPEPLALRRVSTASLVPQNHRVFLILLGRGRLQEPSGNLDAIRPRPPRHRCSTSISTSTSRNKPKQCRISGTSTRESSTSASSKGRSTCST